MSLRCLTAAASSSSSISTVYSRFPAAAEVTSADLICVAAGRSGPTPPVLPAALGSLLGRGGRRWARPSVRSTSPIRRIAGAAGATVVPIREEQAEVALELGTNGFARRCNG